MLLTSAILRITWLPGCLSRPPQMYNLPADDPNVLEKQAELSTKVTEQLKKQRTELKEKHRAHVRSRVFCRQWLCG